MKSAEMLKTELPKGFIFRNIAKLGKKPNWQMIRKKQDTNEVAIKDQLEGNGWLKD